MIKKSWIIFASIAFLLVVGDFVISAPKAFPKDGSIFTIADGQSLASVTRSLSNEHYIRSSLVFGTLVIMFGGEHRISPGDYYFVPGESTIGIARQIAHEDHNLVPIKVTIPEGEKIPEVAALIAQKIPNFDTASFIALATPKEGYLFPETYFFYPTVTPAEIIKEMSSMFDRQTTGLFTQAALAGHTEAEIVTMASLVEREAHGADDRTTIAGILWKRLSLGMRLQVDATVSFAAGVGDAALTKADFSINSPYNTYTHGGLPPGPIASPGLEAIKAALDPAVTSYLYYLHDKNGSIHYAKTYAQHQANIAKYLK